MRRKNRGKQTLKKKMLSILLLCAMSSILAVVIVYDNPNDPERQYPGEYADISGADHTRDGQ